MPDFAATDLILAVAHHAPIFALSFPAPQFRYSGAFFPAFQHSISLGRAAPVRVKRARDSLPLMGSGPMSLKEAIVSCYSKYATFSGRACRSEFWYFVLFEVLVMVALFVGVTIVLGQNGSADIFGALFLCFALATFLPSLAVRVRRLHDTNRSGWMIFITFIPIVGAILILVWDCQRGTKGPNRFGDDPLTDLDEFGPAPGRDTRPGPRAS